MDYIENHIEEKLSLDSISHEMNYSKYYLSRMFVNVVGFTIHGYIQRRRLTEAARLLIFTEKPIMEIALFAGYETQQFFSIGFKALSNLSHKRRKKFNGILGSNIILMSRPTVYKKNVILETEKRCTLTK